METDDTAVPTRNSGDYLHLIGGQFACQRGRHPKRAG